MNTKLNPVPRKHTNQEFGFQVHFIGIDSFFKNNETTNTRRR